MHPGDPAARLGLINDDQRGLQEVSLGNSLCHKLFHFPCISHTPPGKPSAEYLHATVLSYSLEVPAPSQIHVFDILTTKL